MLVQLSLPTSWFPQHLATDLPAERHLKEERWWRWWKDKLFKRRETLKGRSLDNGGQLTWLRLVTPKEAQLCYFSVSITRSKTCLHTTQNPKMIAVLCYQNVYSVLRWTYLLSSIGIHSRDWPGKKLVSYFLSLEYFWNPGFVLRCLLRMWISKSPEAAVFTRWKNYGLVPFSQVGSRDRRTLWETSYYSPRPLPSLQS